MGSVWSLYNIGIVCHVITHVVLWVELPVQRRLYPIFVKSWVPRKGDSMVCCRVTRYPQIFRGLTGCQRTPGIWGVTTYLSRKCIGNDVFLTLFVADDIWKSFHKLHPSCMSLIQLVLALQILQRLMVSVNHKFLGPNIMLPSFQGPNQCIQLFIISRVFQDYPNSFITCSAYKIN